MKYNIKEQKNVSVINLEGNIMGGPDALLLNELLHRLVKEGKKKIVLNLSAVKLMNSSGLGMLIAALTTVRNASGNLKLACVSKKIENLLIITKLINIFEQYKTVKRAVDSYK